MMEDARFPGIIVANRTLREVVHTSIGGNRLRVRISNAYGTTPLRLDDVQVALRENAGRIVAGSTHRVTFSGAAQTTVPVGAFVLSDAVSLSFMPQADLAVSIYTRQAVEAITTHHAALATSYLADGDQAGSVELASAQPIKSWPFLVGVEVEQETSLGAIVAIGSSITDGFASTPDTNHRWPDLLAARLNQAMPATHLGVVNGGIGGNRVLHDGGGPLAALFGQGALARFDRDVLSVAGVSTVIFFEGGNDISQPGSASAPANEAVTAVEIIAGYRQMAERAHEHGIRVIGGTLTPFEGMTSNVYNAEREAERVAVNQWIRTSHDLDGYIDFDHAVLDTSHPARLLPRYDSGDHLHPNDAGYQAMADIIDLSLFLRRSR